MTASLSFLGGPPDPNDLRLDQLGLGAVVNTSQLLFIRLRASVTTRIVFLISINQKKHNFEFLLQKKEIQTNTVVIVFYKTNAT